MDNRLRYAKFHENVFSINENKSNFCPPLFANDVYDFSSTMNHRSPMQPRNPNHLVNGQSRKLHTPRFRHYPFYPRVWISRATSETDARMYLIHLLNVDCCLLQQPI